MQSPSVPEDKPPADADLMLSFLSSLGGVYSGPALQLYLSGVKAWQFSWGGVAKGTEQETELMLAPGDKLAP